MTISRLGNMYAAYYRGVLLATASSFGQCLTRGLQAYVLIMHC